MYCRWFHLFLLCLSGCSVFRVENPNLKRPIGDATKAEIVGWKTGYKSISGPDRVIPAAIDSVALADRALDVSETIHQISPGRRRVTVAYAGARGNVIPEMFSAFAEIPMKAEAGVRYQCRGRIEGDVAVLSIVRLPSGKTVSDEFAAKIGTIGWSGEWKPRR